MRRRQSSSCGGTACWLIATRAHGGVEQADRLVGQLPRRDVTVRQPHRRFERLVEHLDAVMLLEHRTPRRAPSGSPCPRSARRPGRPGSGGSAPDPSRCTSCIPPRSWRRWCAACRAPAPASAGSRHRPCPAAPPAPISVCASSTNRMIGFGDACTSSMTWRSRFSNSPFMLAPACSRPMSSV